MATTAPTGEKPREEQVKYLRHAAEMVILPAVKTPQPQTGKKQRANGKKPAITKSINALQQRQDKFDKYSTYLRPGYKKELKSIALERDCKDYEVLDEALTLFLEARKK
jgi:hypothetical protein